MNKLVTAFQENATTTNGCKTNSTTTNAVLDLFFMAGASRGNDITKEFNKAYVENPTLTTRLLLWLRDVRGGAGERKLFRDLLIELTKQPNSGDLVQQVINKIPELGRFDDLLVLMGTEYETNALNVLKSALDDGNGLAFKWLPRKDKKGARVIREFLGYPNERAWRKYVVANTKVVEQQMCAKQWFEIDFEKVPSLAMARYTNAFSRNASTTFYEYQRALIDGSSTVNAGAVYPYDVVKTLENGNENVANAMWDSLPDYLQGTEENILPIVDSSGSMYCTISGSTQAIDVAVSLGLYLSERNNGAFKDYFMTFSSNPTLQHTTGTLRQRYKQLETCDWGMSTNIQEVFSRILYHAKQNEVEQQDMPSKVLIVSDMEFNQCIRGDSANESIKRLYAEAGYKLPQIVFWNVKARSGNFPVKHNENGVALISGFSPSIMTSVLGSEDLSPEKMMLDTLMKTRYDI